MDIDEQGVLPLRYTILRPQDDIGKELFDIVDQYRRHMLQTPPHQREKVWEPEQDRRWIDRIRKSDVRPIGCIVTYQLNNGMPSPVYLNDGLQRTLATIGYLENPERYGDDPITAEEHVRACIMPLQHRHYKTHEEALLDFQLINLGTHLTPYEFFKGALAYMPNWDGWQRVLIQVGDAIDSQAMRIVKSRYRAERVDLHKRKRFSMALFCRFLSKEKGLMNYEVAKAKADVKELTSGKAIEQRLRRLLPTVSIDDGEAAAKLLEGLIERETALMAEIWYTQMGHSPNEGVSHTLYRWLLDCSVWKRNNNVPHHQWEPFVRKLLASTGGTSVVDEKRGETRWHLTLGLSNMAHLPLVCDALESELCNSVPRPGQRRNRLMAKSGADVSHVLPKCLVGDGPVVVEAAGRNRARGAAPIQSA